MKAKEVETKKISSKTKSNKSVRLMKVIILAVFALFVFNQLLEVKVQLRDGLLMFNTIEKDETVIVDSEKVNILELQSVVLLEEGVELPISWNDLGKRMIADGVIDENKFKNLFSNGLNEHDENMLTGEGNENIVVDQSNSRFVLDILWAFGLANKNDILEKGEMTDEKYGGDASKFASTGGWSLSRGNSMNHYSAHPYVVLTKEQQALVDRVSSGIYRPCCGNSTHFPDCNHGMAMLGLLELMAANNVSEQEMYEVSLKVNSYWFPQTYIDLATYFKEQGQEWNDVDPKLALSQEYSSGQGYSTTRKKIKSLPTPAVGGGGCSA